MNTKKFTTISIDREILYELKKRKIHPRQGYGELILNLLKDAINRFRSCNLYTIVRAALNYLRVFHRKGDKIYSKNNSKKIPSLFKAKEKIRLSLGGKGNATRIQRYYTQLLCNKAK